MPPRVYKSRCLAVYKAVRAIWHKDKLQFADALWIEQHPDTYYVPTHFFKFMAPKMSADVLCRIHAQGYGIMTMLSQDTQLRMSKWLAGERDFINPKAGRQAALPAPKQLPQLRDRSESEVPWRRRSSVDRGWQWREQSPGRWQQTDADEGDADETQSQVTSWSTQPPWRQQAAASTEAATGWTDPPWQARSESSSTSRPTPYRSDDDRGQGWRYY